MTSPDSVFAGSPNPKFREAMSQEHRSTKKFTTTNYGVTTSPAEEWEAVVRSDKRPHQTREDDRRRIPNLQELLEREAAEDEPKEQGAATTRLTEDEIIAIVLYTGPMVRPATQICQADFDIRDLYIAIFEDMQDICKR